MYYMSKATYYMYAIPNTLCYIEVGIAKHWTHTHMHTHTHTHIHTHTKYKFASMTNLKIIIKIRNVTTRLVLICKLTSSTACNHLFR